MVQMLGVCLDRHLVRLCVQVFAMYNADYHQTWYKSSMHEVQWSILRTLEEKTIRVCYRAKQLCTLDLGSSRHFSWADSMWHVARMLVDDILHIAQMLADGMWHVSKMLANVTYVNCLGY